MDIGFSLPCTSDRRGRPIKRLSLLGFATIVVGLVTWSAPAACIAHGVYLHPHHNWFLSAAHTEADVGRVLEVTEEAFHEVARC